jgi:hypothetical protein
MPEQKKQWKVIRIDNKVMDKVGNFFSIGDKFSGSPKPMLRKMEEKIER